MSTGTLTCTVGSNNVQINRRDADCVGAPNSVYARINNREGPSVYVEEHEVVKILELMGVLKDITSSDTTSIPKDKKAWAKKRSTFSSTAA